MNDDQLLRYARHIMLPQLGLEAQNAWLRSHVLLVGAGGLGCAAAQYLASSGVGQLTVVDNDVVELHNLQRQTLHTTARLGQPKVASVAAALHALNPEVQVHAVQQRADREWVLAWLLEWKAQTAAAHDNGFALVLDCSDNFATRHAVNAACVAAGVPLVSGSALGLDGQVAVFNPRVAASPCYACAFPQPVKQQPTESTAPEGNCATMGVFAPLVGVVGNLQAAYVLQMLCQPVNTPSPLLGKLQLLSFGSGLLHTETLRLPRREGCGVCGSIH